jgi:hypothetical protein
MELTVPAVRPRGAASSRPLHSAIPNDYRGPAGKCSSKYLVNSV